MTTLTKTETHISREPPRRAVAATVWKGITVMFVVLACVALLYGHGRTDGATNVAFILLFFATLTGLVAWSVGASGRPEQAKIHKRATHALAWSIALAPLVVMLLCGGWIAAGVYASILLVAWLNILAGGVPVGDGDGSWSEDWFDDEDISNRDGIKSTYTDPSYSYMPENIYYTGD